MPLSSEASKRAYGPPTGLTPHTRADPQPSPPCSVAEPLGGVNSCRPADRGSWPFFIGLILRRLWRCSLVKATPPPHHTHKLTHTYTHTSKLLWAECGHFVLFFSPQERRLSSSAWRMSSGKGSRRGRHCASQTLFHRHHRRSGSASNPLMAEHCTRTSWFQLVGKV